MENPLAKSWLYYIVYTAILLVQLFEVTQSQTFYFVILILLYIVMLYSGAFDWIRMYKTNETLIKEYYCTHRH